MRVGPKAIPAYPWYLRPFFWNQRRKYGRVLDAALLWARSPRLFLGVAVLYGLIDRRKSPIEPALRSLVTVRVSQINWCAFCVDLNSATLMKRGASMAKVEALEHWRDSDLFDERERLALDYAETMTHSDRRVDDGAYGRLKEYFDDDAIIELTALIAFQNMSSKFNSALAVPPQGFCQLPDLAANVSGVHDGKDAADPGHQSECRTHNMSVTVSRSFSASVRPRFFLFPGIATPIMSDTRPAAVFHPPSHRRSGPASGRPKHRLQPMPKVRKTPPSLVAAWFPICVGMTT